MSKSSIEKIAARQIFDSRGRPTIEVDVLLENGSFGRAAVPSGASTGTFEAHELRDRDKKSFDGLSVYRAIENVNVEIADHVRGFDALDQRRADELLRKLDGTIELKRLGANAVLGASMAIARAAAAFQKLPLYRWIAEISATEKISLPLPMVNILSGGLHAARGMDVQDFLFVPSGVRTIDEAIAQIAKVRAKADRLAQEKDLPILLAAEGGLSPRFKNGRYALEFMVETFERAKLKPFEEAQIAIDVAASALQTIKNDYYFPRENRRYTSGEIIETVEEWTKDFPISSVEDALGEEDWANWTVLNHKLGNKIQIVGDDLFTTNLQRVEKGIREKAANAVLIKLNQNGTLTGTLDVIKKAKDNNLRTIVSARSGETEDSFLVDLAVGTNAGQIKIGSFRNSERLSKYNQLIRIAEETGAEINKI